MGRRGTLIDPYPLIEARAAALFGSADTMMAFCLPILLGVTGAVIGSFAGAAALRIARGDSVVTGRSRCDSCGRVLGVGDLVPVLSFLMLAGRCRTCRAPIDPLQPLAEVVGAAIGLAAWLFMPGPLTAIPAAVLGWQLLVLGLSDWRSFHLPPVGIAILAFSALMIPALAALDGQQLLPLLLRQLAGGGLGFVLLAAPALLFRAIRGREGMGSADPPLMGAIGLWAGPLGVCFIVLLAAGLGIAIAAAKLMRGKSSDHSDSAASEGDSGNALPLGTLLSLATVAVSFAGFSLLTP